MVGILATANIQYSAKNVFGLKLNYVYFSKNYEAHLSMFTAIFLWEKKWEEILKEISIQWGSIQGKDSPVKTVGKIYQKLNYFEPLQSSVVDYDVKEVTKCSFY